MLARNKLVFEAGFTSIKCAIDYAIACDACMYKVLFTMGY